MTPAWSASGTSRRRNGWATTIPSTSIAIVDLGITPDKKTLVAVDGKGLVKIANIADHKKREVVGSVVAHPAGARALLVSPTGSTFLTVGNDNEIKVWPLGAGRREGTRSRSAPGELPVTVNAVAYTPDGKQVVTANADGTAYVLELPVGTESNDHPCTLIPILVQRH